MHRATLYLILAMVTTSAMADVTIDEDYMQVMGDRQKSLANNITLSHAKDALDDVKELDDMFTDVETFYIRKGNTPDAVKWSTDSKELLGTIRQYVSTNNYDSASTTAVTLAKTCKECHSIYKKEK